MRAAVHRLLLLTTVGACSTAVTVTLAAQPRGDTLRLCLRDAVTSAPVVGATVRLLPSGSTNTVRSDCVRVQRGADSALMVSRFSYAPVVVALPSNEASLTVALTLRVLLPPQVITARRDDASVAGRVTASLSSTEARTRGVSGMNGVLAQLPYTTLRSARGESGLSLRGARREQVVVTLDGLPLNDPATGLADVSDLPLVAVQSVTVSPGSDPVGAGLGATGGVVALSTASQRLLSLRTGAFGAVGAEGAWIVQTSRVRWHAAASHYDARNDFPFVNDAGVAAVAETRANNDEQRSAIVIGALGERGQFTLLASTGERGMVGAANVRAYDQDRSRTSRVNARGQLSIARTVVVGGVRAFALDYRDPSRPALDSRSRAWAGDLEWKGPALLGTWRTGIGIDGLAGTGGIEQRRTRAFAAWSWQRPAAAASAFDFDLGVRSDVVERAGLQPSAGAGVSWRVAGRRDGSALVVASRAAQAVRVPTLYDLYFSSPQRLFVRALSPERVTLDASIGLQGALQRSSWRASGEVMTVARDTRNAIIWFPGNFGWSPANVGRERLRGVESRVDLHTAPFSAGAWGTWYESTLRSGGLAIPTPYVPQLSGGARAQWRFGHDARSAVSGTLRVQGPRPFSAGPRDARFELGAVHVLDAALSRRIPVSDVDALLSLGIDNLTDTRWQSVRGFPMPGRAWTVACTVQPRS